MNYMTRRNFLTLSLAAAGLWLTACTPLQSSAARPQPTVLPVPTPQDVDLLAADVRTAVENTVAFMMDRAQLPGIAIGIVKDGEPIYTQGFGVVKAGEDKPVTDQSLFQTMDMTHVFTTTAVMQLAEQGKLDLDAPVVEYLPYFQLDDERAKQITMRHLLTQTAGLPSKAIDRPEIDWVGKTSQTDDAALERYVRSLTDVRLSHTPGDLLLFCDMSFDIAGDVIAKVSGMVFEDYMAQHVLQPLGMSQSTFYPQQANPDLLATPHVLQGAQAVPSELVTYSRERAPSVGLFSNVTDLLRWTQANLNRGELDGEHILQAASYDQLWSPFRPYVYPYVSSDFEAMGMGWTLGTLLGRPMVQYHATDLGFNGALCLVPEQKIGAVVLGNQFTSLAITSPIALTLAETLLEITAL